MGSIFSLASVILIYLTFQRQQETSVLQQFETTFFNLLAVQREMMRSVKGKYLVKGNLLLHEGHDFFERMAAELNGTYILFPDAGTKTEIRTAVCVYYEEQFSIAGPSLGPYYRHLYHFIKYTNNSQIKGQSASIWISFRLR
jgi:hypothetical protein